MAELKVREAARYNAFYCGLCRAIGKRFSQLPRSLLNYDCTFVALLLSGIGTAPTCVPKRCAYRLHKGKRPMVVVDTQVMRFCADLNVLLAYIKLADDMHDEHRAVSYAGYAMFRSAYKKARKLRPQLDAVIIDGVEKLSALERSNCPEIDLVANTFADMMVKVFNEAPVEDAGCARTLSLLAFNLGRWIYLIDAFDDRESDKKHGSYNPFNLADIDRERAEYMLYKSLNEAVLAYDLLSISSEAAILDNIMRDGCFTVTQNLLRRSK